MSNYLSDEYLLEAMKFLYEGEIIEAKKKLEYIIETEPGYGRAHYLLGCIYWKLFNDYQSATGFLI